MNAVDKSQIPRFRDFSEEVVLTGDKIDMRNVIGKEIIVTAFRISKSKYNKRDTEMCLKLQFQMDGKEYVLFTGSVVLMEQIEKYQAKIPFLTTIVGVDRYYTFS